MKEKLQNLKFKYGGEEDRFLQMLSGELAMDGKRYFLSYGKWYRQQKSYQEAVAKQFESIVRDACAQEDPNKILPFKWTQRRKGF